MSKRLVKVAQELNIGTNTIVEFLKEKGVEIENRPTSKVTDEMEALLVEEYSKRIAIKEQTDSMTIGLRPSLKKDISVHEETVVVAPPPPRPVIEPKPVPEVEDSKKEELLVAPPVEAKPEKEEPKIGLRIKGKIELDKKGLPVKEKIKEPSEKEKPKEDENVRAAAPKLRGLEILEKIDVTAKRLVKVAQELNVGTNVIVEFLKGKGFEIENRPTAKVTREMQNILKQEYSKSIAIREQADSMTIGLRPSLKKEPSAQEGLVAPQPPKESTEKDEEASDSKIIETISESGDQLDFILLCKEFNIDKENLLQVLNGEGYQIENKPNIRLTAKSFQTLKKALPKIINTEYKNKQKQKPQIKIAVEKIALIKKTKAKFLDLSNIGLDYLPDEIFNLSSLTKINLKGNNLKFLPLAFKKLNNLIELDLGKNLFTDVPEEIISLKSLEILNIADNKIEEITERIILCKKLQILDLSNNRIQVIPPQVGLLDGLRQLKLSNNEIETLSEEIQELEKLEILDLSKNNLSKLPEYVINLPNLFEIYTHSNPIQNIPLEIYDKKGNRIRALRDYHDSLESGKTNRLFEVKLIIIGNGNAGKTTLTKKLIRPHGTFHEGEKSTEGIDIRKWNLNVKDIKKFNGLTNTVKIKVWDFGGQEIYRSTHRFFLTKRSIYLFVWDARGNDTYEHFDYWLNIVQTLGGSSPLIMAMNKSDVREKEIDNESLQENYPFIFDFERVSCKTGRGINDLIRVIKKVIANLDHLGEEWPKERLDIKYLLEREKRSYISYDEFKLICKSKGLNNKQTELISEYLHDLGTIMHFQDNNVLRQLVILKPDWATAAVYKVLDTQKIQEKYGEFTIDDLKKIWSANEDYIDKYDQLLEMMIKFELCFKLNFRDVYIAPELLSSQKPNYIAFNDKTSLNFEYHYEFMPSGILNSFICRNAKLIEGKGYWKNGVILNNRKGKSRAEIFTKPFEKNKRVIIRVDGKTRMDKINLLSKIRDSFDEIHDKYQGLKYKEMVSCSCHYCINSDRPNFYDYSLLEKCRLHNRKEVFCQEGITDVSIENLLRGVTDTGQYKIFFSYSSKDKELRDRLDTHLKVLQRNELISTWYDNEILPGQDWSQEINNELNSADFILLLISADYFESDYCTQEMKIAIARHYRNEAIVIPIILKECNWESSIIKDINILPRKGKAVSKFKNIDSIMTKISKELENLIIMQSELNKV